MAVDRAERAKVLDRLLRPPFALAKPGQATRRFGLIRVLDWLEQQPGDTWQERWIASGADAAGTRLAGAGDPVAARPPRLGPRHDPSSAAGCSR